jgi:hypothetical protein
VFDFSWGARDDADGRPKGFRSLNSSRVVPVVTRRPSGRPSGLSGLVTDRSSPFPSYLWLALSSFGLALSPSLSRLPRSPSPEFLALSFTLLCHETEPWLRSDS